nr:hypothetical transcript [Hymenolepis microstoma]
MSVGARECRDVSQPLRLGRSATQVSDPDANSSYQPFLPATANNALRLQRDPVVYQNTVAKYVSITEHTETTPRNVSQAATTPSLTVLSQNQTPLVLKNEPCPYVKTLLPLACLFLGAVGEFFEFSLEEVDME